MDLHDFVVVFQVAPIFSMDDDLLADSFESQTKHNSELATETPYLLSVNQFLESVCYPFHTLLLSVYCFIEYQCKGYSDWELVSYNIIFNSVLYMHRSWKRHIKLEEFLSQLHLMCLTRKWPATVRHYSWESSRRCLMWWLSNRNRKVGRTLPYKVMSLRWRRCHPIPRFMWVIMGYFLVLVNLNWARTCMIFEPGNIHL